MNMVHDRQGQVDRHDQTSISYPLFAFHHLFVRLAGRYGDLLQLWIEGAVA